MVKNEIGVTSEPTAENIACGENVALLCEEEEELPIGEKEAVAMKVTFC